MFPLGGSVGGSFSLPVPRRQVVASATISSVVFLVVTM